MSVRSRTPDFHRSSLSPSTTPGSPLSPAFRCTPIDPSPLSMTPIEPLSAAKVASAVAKLTSKPAHSNSSSNSPSASDKDSSRLENHQEVRTTDSTMTKPQGNSVSNEDESSNMDESEESQQETFSPKLIKINVLGSERSLNRKPAHPPTTHHPAVISPKPISPTAQRSSIIAVPETARAPMVISLPSTPVQEEEAKKGKDEVMNSAEAALSMESVVLSTQISETSNSSACRSPELEESSRPMSPAVAPEETKATTTLTADASTPTRTTTTTTKTKFERPILHPLDVKVSAGIMAANVSAHSRKCKVPVLKHMRRIWWSLL